MKALLFSLILCSVALCGATTLDEQIAAALAQQQAADVLANQLVSQKYAQHLDSLLQQDAVLAAHHIRVIPHQRDSMQTYVLCDSLQALDFSTIKKSLILADIPYETRGDSLYVRRDRVQRVGAVIAQVLQE